MGQAQRKTYKYTQDYPSERKDYPSGRDEHPSEKVVQLPRKPQKKSTEEKPENEKAKHEYKPVQGDPEEGGKIPPDEAERISSGDLPS